MRQIIALLFLFLFYSGYTQIIISEFQASNSSTICDEWGDYDDWIELFNPTDDSVNIEGLVLKNNIHVWGIPTGDTSTLLSPGSYFLIWADHEESEGIFHANFRLSAGEDLIICETDSITIIDSIGIPALSEDVSYGICPDGSWKIFNTPSPLEQNNCESTINQTTRTHDLLIYPKITRDKIFIIIPDNIKDRIDIKLISISGNTLIRKSDISEELTINLEQYNSGVYILLLSSKTANWSEKILKVN